MTGNRTLDTALTALGVLSTLGVLGVFLYTEMVYQKPLPSEESGKELLIKESKQDILFEPFKLKSLTVNLRSPTKRLRFLEIEVQLLPLKEEYRKFFESNESFIYDIVIDIAGAMDPDELNSVSGKILLEERIKKRLHSKFNKNVIKEIFFSKFVVQ